MRDYAQVRLSIWNDDDFRELSPAAQWLYFLLLTHPTLTSAGVGDWRPAVSPPSQPASTLTWWRLRGRN